MPAEAKLDRLMMPELLRQKHLISERATEGFPSVRIQQLTAVASKRFLERQNPRASSTMPSDLSRRGTTSAPIVYRRKVRIFLAEMIATRGFVRTTHFSRARLWHFPTDAEALRVEHLQIQLDRTCVLVCRGYRSPRSDCSPFDLRTSLLILLMPKPGDARSIVLCCALRWLQSQSHFFSCPTRIPILPVQCHEDLHCMAWREYHELTKHSVESLRRTQHYLDWANMPDPFRHYDGVPVLDLPADPPAPQISALEVLEGKTGTTLARDGAEFLSQLMFYSASISASKRVPSTGAVYALRVNPSSGNLHPTEFHFCSRGLARWPLSLPSLIPYGRTTCHRRVWKEACRHLCPAHFRSDQHCVARSLEIR